jgi:4-amino-4-deoxy-L-arabinose transferase-like glycosyltransferase|tara:strand:+ start:15246 stop:16457 length:1212 start_codon:yes stop_codon:yes gene_type:complete
MTDAVIDLDQSNKRAILYLCIFGFFLRAVYILFFNPNISFPDEQRFWQEASSLLSGQGIQIGADGKRAHDMPLTAIIISLVYYITEGSMIGVKMFFAVLSTATIYLIAKLAELIGGNKKSALIAASIASVYPFFIYYSSLILSETLFLLFVTLMFVQLMNKDNKSQVLSGITIGFSHLIRPTLLYYVPVILIWQYFISKCSLKSIISSILLIVLVITPWGVRNKFSLGEFYIFTSGAGQVLLEGNNKWNISGGVSGSFESPDAYLKDVPQGLSELDEDRWKRNKALEYIKNNKKHSVKQAFKKLIRFWNIWPNSPDYQSWFYKFISIASFGVILCLALISVFILRKDYKKLSLIYLFVIYYSLIHAITIGSIRYRLPLEPLLIAIGSAGLSKMASKKAIEQKH